MESESDLKIFPDFDSLIDSDISRILNIPT